MPLLLLDGLDEEPLREEVLACGEDGVEDGVGPSKALTCKQSQHSVTNCHNDSHSANTRHFTSAKVQSCLTALKAFPQPNFDRNTSDCMRTPKGSLGYP